MIIIILINNSEFVHFINKLRTISVLYGGESIACILCIGDSDIELLSTNMIMHRRVKKSERI